MFDLKRLTTGAGEGVHNVKSLFLKSHLVDGFGAGHSREAHIMFAFPPEHIEFLAVDFHLKRVVLDLGAGLNFANFVGHAVLFGCLPHL